MSRLIFGFQLSLLCLSALGFYFTWYLVSNNGVSNQLEKLRDHGPHWLPGTEEPLRRSFTGIAAIDHQLTVLVCCFWGIVDGSNAGASLHAYLFAGQVAGLWGLIVLESTRNGNAWNAISFISVFGMILQNLAHAVITPLYLALHLWISPTTQPTKSNISSRTSHIYAIPISIAIGFIAPSILLSLPAPSVISFDQKQIFIAVWQAFPLWVSLCQQLVQSGLEVCFPGLLADQRQARRLVYAFLMLVAGGTHVQVLTICLFSMLFPDTIAPAYRAAFQLDTVGMPAAFSPAFKPADIGSGMMLLFQWDEIIGGTAVLVWALALYIQAKRARRSAINRATVLLGGCSLMTSLAGPATSAIALMWARDELIANDEQDRKKKL